MWGLVLSFLEMARLSPIPFIAGLIGTSEPALKLLLSILMAYPTALVFTKYFRQFDEIRKPYIIVFGIDMAYFNFGLSMFHNIATVLIMYLFTKLIGPGKIHVIITLIFNMTYLVAGYIITESEEYDITWTMPQCVLALKLISLSMDLWDGQKLLKGNEQLSENNKKSALVKPPSFIDLMAYVYFPSCFLVGPIFSFRRYWDYVNDKFPIGEEDMCNKQAMTRLLQGLLYLAAFQIGVSVFSMKFIQSDEFWECTIWYRHLYCGLWAHFALYKYISCWLLTEASCIRFGISYNGQEKTPEGAFVSRWDGCSNIKLMRFELATKFQHYIDSFNCNTNHFAAEYIYKRLRFLGNRNLSQGLTLLFLALWHGIRSGYYMTFINEFLIIYMEKELESMISNTSVYKWMWERPLTKYLLFFLLKLYTIVFMGWSLVPFDVKVFSKWWPIYTSLYFSGFVVFLPWGLLYKPLLRTVLKK